MRYLVQFQVNIFSLLILFGLYLFFRLFKVKTFSKQLIHLLIIATAVGIIMEPLAWIFDGAHFPGAFYLEYMTNFILFLCAPIIAGLLISYVDYRIYKNPKRIMEKWYFQQVSLLTLLLLIFNIFKPIYFRIIPNSNTFNRGELSYIHYALIFGLYLYIFYLILKNIKTTPFNEVKIFFFIFSVPIIGMVIQMFESKFNLAWTSVVFVLFIIYVFLETAPTEEDYLTKLYNRKSYEAHLTHLILSQQPFGVIIFDLNDFKQINDEYGHVKGDYVLIAFGEVLKNVFEKEGFVSRLGGDEFAVVLSKSSEDIIVLMAAISDELCKYSDPVIQELTFSYGFQNYSKDMTIDDLYTSADKKMYENKKVTKRSSLNAKVLADNANDVIWTMDLTGKFTYISPSVKKLRGYTPEEVMNQSKEELLCPESLIHLERGLEDAMYNVQNNLPFKGFRDDVEQPCKDGTTVWTDLTVSGIYDKDNQFVGMLGVSRDITKRKKFGEEILQITEIDSLTQLLNRLKLTTVINMEIMKSIRNSLEFTIMIMDIDYFKNVNDTYGYVVGDEVLKEVAGIIEANIRKNDIAGRWGGEEFMIVLPESNGYAGQVLAEKLRYEMSEYHFSGIGSLTASFGIAEFQKGSNETEMVSRADEALYEAKNTGRNRVCIH